MPKAKTSVDIELGRFDNQDLDYFVSQGFEVNPRLESGQFKSGYFKHIALTLRGASIFGYQLGGFNYHNIKVFPHFAIDRNGTEYQFQIFSLELSSEDNEYLLTTYTKLNIDDRSISIDSGLLEKCNQFIDWVKPLVEYDYVTSFDDVFKNRSLYLDIDFFDRKIVSQVGDYSQVEGKMANGECFIKGNYLIHRTGSKLDVYYYDQQTKMVAARKEDDNYSDYVVSWGDEAVSKEVYLVPKDEQFEYLLPEINQQIRKLIQLVDEEYDIAKEQLVIE